MNLFIEKSTLKGYIKAPPSKSMAHRLLIAAAISDGTSEIQNIALSEDITATVSSLSALGAEITVEGGVARVTRPVSKSGGVRVLDCNESGSTLRFLIPIAAALGGEYIFIGKNRLMERPMAVYDEVFCDSGVDFKHHGDKITISGGLKAGEYEIRGNVSSQFVTGMLYALSMCKGESRIKIKNTLESRPYVDMTLSALSMFGVNIKEAENEYVIPGDKTLSARDLYVEGDYSNAAFFDAFNYLGGDVIVGDLSKNSLQGDRAYKEYFERLKKGFCRIDITDTPDLAPILMTLSSVLNGSELVGTRRLSIKESDRGAVMKEELSKFGIVTELSENSITVYKGTLKTPCETVCSHNDHRIAMALTVLLTVTSGEISGVECTSKSMPDFYDAISSLGARMH